MYRKSVRKLDDDLYIVITPDPLYEFKCKLMLLRPKPFPRVASVYALLSFNTSDEYSCLWLPKCLLLISEIRKDPIRE